MLTDFHCLWCLLPWPEQVQGFLQLTEVGSFQWKEQNGKCHWVSERPLETGIKHNFGAWKAVQSTYIQKQWFLLDREGGSDSGNLHLLALVGHWLCRLIYLHLSNFLECLIHSWNMCTNLCKEHWDPLVRSSTEDVSGVTQSFKWENEMSIAWVDTEVKIHPIK